MTDNIVPEGPYTYDDPRFIYDEPCMFYDGGFDIECITGITTLPKRIGSPSSARINQKYKIEKDLCEEINIVVACALKYVNNKKYIENEVVKKYKFVSCPIEITIDELRCKKKTYNVSVESIKSNIAKLQKVMSLEIKLLPVKTIVSGSVQLRKTKYKKIVAKLKT